MQGICFIDTETTSLSEHTREIWEVGVIKRPTHGEEETYHFFVDANLSTADPASLKIGGYYNRHPLGIVLAGGVDRDRTISVREQARQYAEQEKLLLLSRMEAAEEIAVITNDCHVVGAVPSFDTNSMQRLVWEAGLGAAWHYHLIDIEVLAVGYMRAMIEAGKKNGRELSQEDGIDPTILRMIAAEIKELDYASTLPYDSEALGAALGVAILDEARHTALGDADWVRRFWDRIMEGTPDPVAADLED